MRRPLRLFCFQLAAELGMTVKELLSRMDSHELSEWAAYYRTQNEDWQKRQPQSKRDMQMEFNKIAAAVGSMNKGK